MVDRPVPVAPSTPASVRLLPLTSAPASTQVLSPGLGSEHGHTDERRAVLARRVQLFVAATITYNIVEAVIALVAGTRASSTALVGFGLDSVVEVASAAAVAWQFSTADERTREAREQRALRIIALSFFALAAYVGVESARALLIGGRAQESVVGVVLAAVSVVVMPALSWGQRRAGRQLGSASAVADSHQTLLCTYLSGVLLVGLLFNTALGWWWADPVAAAVIAAVAVREGVQTWRGDGCCAPSVGAVAVAVRSTCRCEGTCCAP